MSKQVQTMNELAKRTATNILVDVSGNIYGLQYHETRVVMIDRINNTITLNTGGWNTKTTKERMNDFCRLLGIDIQVHQKDFKFFVTKEGKELGILDQILTINL